jgi:hypothetical protein
MSTEDITRADELIRQEAGRVGLQQTALDAGERLLQEYGQKRDAAFDAMVSFLGRSDESGIDEDWKDCCSNGKEALSHLNDGMPPEGGEGLAGIGADAFYRGELKMWEQNAKAEIAFAAQEIETIRLIHQQIIEDCKETLETIKDKDAVIQEAVRGIFPSVTTELVDFANNARKLVLQATSSHKFDWLAPFNTQVSDFLANTFKSARDQSRQRAALKKNLVDHYKTIVQTQAELGKWKLDETLKDGAAAGDALLNNKDGDYEARDWQDFVVRCKEALNRRYDAAETSSEELFGAVFDTLKQRIAVDFETLSDDASKLIAWLQEIDRDFSDLQSVIDDQSDLMSGLVAGPMRDGIASVINTIKSMVQASLSDYSQMKEDIKKDMDQQ